MSKITVNLCRCGKQAKPIKNVESSEISLVCEHCEKATDFNANMWKVAEQWNRLNPTYFDLEKRVRYLEKLIDGYAEIEKALDQLIDTKEDCPPVEPFVNCPADLLAKYGSSDELCRECWKRFLMGGEK